MIFTPNSLKLYWLIVVIFVVVAVVLTAIVIFVVKAVLCVFYGLGTNRWELCPVCGQLKCGKSVDFVFTEAVIVCADIIFNIENEKLSNCHENERNLESRLIW